ncbi:MAG: DUF927 domain-containing protein [Acidobacteriaceae bacterium]|nr:DUF927 domain-containing protein [Acidobacteriaceae bacterium]
MKMSKGRTDKVNIIAQGKNEVGDRYLLLRIQDDDNVNEHVLAVGASKEPDCAPLNRLGAAIFSPDAKREFMKRVQDEGSSLKVSFKVADRLGWHGRRYAHPAFPSKKLRLAIDEQLISKYRSGGSLEGWRKIAELASGNSRLMLAIALAFVGPIGPIIGARSMAIQLTSSKTGVGKTTALIVAGSVWGCKVDRNQANELGFGETWNQTANNLEHVAWAHNHTFLPLDETRHGDPKQILPSIFRLSGGLEKGRLTNPSSGRSWWVPVLSTSNLSVQELAGEASISVDGAYMSRLLDVPEPPGGHGIFEELHGLADGEALSDQLKTLAKRHFGHPSVCLITALKKRCKADRKALRKWLRARKRSYIKRAVKELRFDVAGLDQLHDRFSTIYVSACFAIEEKILPWKKKELLAALLKCERAHLDLQITNKSVGDSSGKPPIERLRTFIAENRTTFASTNDITGKVDKDCVYTNRHKGRDEILFSEEKFQAIVGGLGKAMELKHLLRQQGLIASDGKKRLSFSVKRPVGNKRAYFIAVSARIAADAT